MSGLRGSNPRAAAAFLRDLAFTNARGRVWLVEVKSSSRPDLVTHAAERLAEFAGGEAVPLLVVPYMSCASRQTVLAVCP